MRFFVTGATGHIGSAVTAELLATGHQVTGLARSDKSAQALAAAGAGVLRGSLEDLDALRNGAAACDGVLHLAYIHNAGQGVDASAIDLRAVETIGAALDGSLKPFVVTSGTLVLSPGRVGTEDDQPGSGAPAVPRIATENLAVRLGTRGIRSCVIRLPPSVHSSFDSHGFIPRLIGIARRTGVSAYIGDGANRWPGVHTLDASRLFRLAALAAAPGSRLHGVGDLGVPFRDIAESIARNLGVPAVPISRHEADAHFGWLSGAVAADNPVSNALTRHRTGWNPAHPGLLADLDEGHYFIEKERSGEDHNR